MRNLLQIYVFGVDSGPGLDKELDHLVVLLAAGQVQRVIQLGLVRVPEWVTMFGRINLIGLKSIQVFTSDCHIIFKFSMIQSNPLNAAPDNGSILLIVLCFVSLFL